LPAGKLHVKKGDQVFILSGKDKGKKGKVLSALPNEKKVTVEGINIIKRHARPTQKVPQGGIREMEAPIYADKVMVVCPSCQKQTKTFDVKLSSGKKIRSCKKCGEYIDK